MQNYLIQSAGDLKRKVFCVLDQVFPEYQTIFSNTFGTTSKQLLLDFSSLLLVLMPQFPNLKNLKAHNVMCKRDSPYLRKALFQAALVASNTDPALKDYY